MLLGADTNIIIRLIIDDDAAQIDRILALLTEHELFVPLTVMLEAEWVLRSRYSFSRQDIAIAFSALCKLESIIVEEVDTLNWAIDRYAKSGDFGDLVHLVACGDCEGFATFDEGLRRSAGAESPIAVLSIP